MFDKINTRIIFLINPQKRYGKISSFSQNPMQKSALYWGVAYFPLFFKKNH
ncbi:MAG: hypothetical protein RL757_259 [Bacteroidota bacterium]|jgi:hypothetical protein